MATSPLAPVVTILLLAGVTGKTRAALRRIAAADRRGKRNQSRVLTIDPTAPWTGVAAVVTVDDRADELAVLFLRGDEVSFGGLEGVSVFLQLHAGLHALVGNFLFNCLHG